MRFSGRHTEVSEGRVTDREKRKGERLNSRVPVTLEWKGKAGEACNAKVHTRVVGPYGCLLVLSAEVGIEQPVRVTNLTSGNSSDAVVVWRGYKQSDGWELGIKLIEPEIDFWGLEL